MINLSSQNLGKTVQFIDDMIYVKETNKFITGTSFGIIQSLLIDINFGAYGYSIKYKDSNYSYNFILKNEFTKRLNGDNIDKLTLID